MTEEERKEKRKAEREMQLTAVFWGTILVNSVFIYIGYWLSKRAVLLPKLSVASMGLVAIIGIMWAIMFIIDIILFNIAARANDIIILAKDGFFGEDGVLIMSAISVIAYPIVTASILKNPEYYILLVAVVIIISVLLASMH